MKKYSLVFIILILSNFSFGQVITIDSVRKQNANGVPLLLNQIVTVQGVVTTQRELGNPLVYFQVPTAGLVAYDTLIGNYANRGDSVQVTGKVVQYNGLTELQPVSSYTLLGTGKTVNPLVVTPSNINSSGETYEGMLIKINGITQVKNTSGVVVTQWTVTGSGTNYRIFVGTDSCEIRIYTTTNIANTFIPPTPFSVTALCSQYKASSPFFGGYQIIPRDLNDIVSQASGPVIATTPMESAIAPNSVTLSWLTLNAGDTKVKYFITDSLYQPLNYTDSVYNATQVTNHSITLNNLRPGKIYLALISSTNISGTSTYFPKYFSTASHTASTGKIEVYFNRSVDTLLALPNNTAIGLVDLKTRLGQRIDSATKSIDMAIYSFNDITQIKDKIILAVVRGVKVRIVYDSRTNQQLITDLISAGIKVQKRNTNTSDLMHNKFLIFDARDTSSYADDWLWGGSANITYEQFYNDAQNVIIIQDESLCAAFTREFEEMWGSHTDDNIPSRAKFGPQKSDNTPHIFNVKGKKIECYFSPSDNVSTQIESLIDLQTNKSINFCIYSFTRYQIANKMKAKYNPPTVMVRGVFDDSQAWDTTNGMYYEMNGQGTYGWNPRAKVWLDGKPGLLHHKYMVIDADLMTSNPVVQTGSFNYSNNATNGNDENILIIYDSLVANQYYQEFSKRVSDAGGSLNINILSTGIPENFVLFQNYPNPFNPETKIKFSIPNKQLLTLSIFNSLGQLISILYSDYLGAGTYEYLWKPENISSGVYYYRLKGDNFIDTKKMIFIK